MQSVEITQRELNKINEMRASGLRFLQVVPDPTKDSPTEMINYTQSDIELDHLCELGFVEHITVTDPGPIEQLRKMYERDFRVFKLTPLARKMFSHEASAEVN